LVAGGDGEKNMENAAFNSSRANVKGAESSRCIACEDSMSRKKWRFAPTEVKRAIRLVKDTGLEINKVEIGADGRIILGTGKPVGDPGQDANPWDEVLGDAENEKRAS
jgi:hypothetical protein